MSTMESNVPTLVFLDLTDQAPAKIFSIKMLAASDIAAFLVCGACVCRFLDAHCQCFHQQVSFNHASEKLHIFFSENKGSIEVTLGK